MATTLEATTLESVATSSESALLPLPPSFEHCIGEEVKSRAGFFHIQCWRPKGVVVSVFVDQIKPEIENLRQTHLPQRPGDEWIGLTCFMIRSLRHLRPQAFPYICFSSIKPEPRKQLRDLVKKEKILQKYPGFRTRDWKMDPDSYGMKSCGSESTAGDDAAYMLRIDSRASCFSGATIHIRQSGMNQSWRLAATSGGLLSNENGTVFLITANHALSNKAYAILPPTTAALDCAAGSDDSSDGDDEPGIDSMALKTIDYTHTLVPLVKSPASLIEKKLSASTSHVEFDSSTLFPPFAEFPEERAPATSSIFAEGPSMRSERSDRPALDYALIQLGSSLSISTVVSLPSRQKFIDSVPKRPERKAVLAVTASYRQIRGHLHEVPTFIMHSRTGGSQEFWKATFEDEIREGDCGSWVFDARDGAVIGHIVATSSVTGLTLLVPMAQILEDVGRRLGGTWVPTSRLDQLKPIVERYKSVSPNQSKLKRHLSQTSEQAMAFACPFAKRDPVKYMRCLFSYHTTWRYLREHLRTHYVQQTCPVCGEQFPSTASQNQHIIERFCKTSQFRTDVITENMQMQIDLAEEQRGDNTSTWYAMWDIIFPDAPRPATPLILETPAETAMKITKRIQNVDWLYELKTLFLSLQDTSLHQQAEEIAQAVQELLSARLIGDEPMDNSTSPRPSKRPGTNLEDERPRPNPFWTPAPLLANQPSTYASREARMSPRRRRMAYFPDSPFSNHYFPLDHQFPPAYQSLPAYQSSSVQSSSAYSLPTQDQRSRPNRAQNNIPYFVNSLPSLAPSQTLRNEYMAPAAFSGTGWNPTDINQTELSSVVQETQVEYELPGSPSDVDPVAFGSVAPKTLDENDKAEAKSQ